MFNGGGLISCVAFDHFTLADPGRSRFIPDSPIGVAFNFPDTLRPPHPVKVPFKMESFNAGAPNFGSPDDFGIKFQEAFTTTYADQDFWELQSKNIWGPKLLGNHCFN